MPYDMSVDLKFFRDRNYERQQCPACGGWYWGIKGVHDRCGDTPCVEYSFIGAPKTPVKYDVSSMRERYLLFFERNGHTRVGRLPVIARWRDDVFLVNASIYDFQPHVTSGEVPPPANPLTISQPCIRLTDLDSVGRSGRHLSNFEMMAHHAFNRPKEPGGMIYWKEDCTRYCHELLVKDLGMPERDVTYKENPWMGGGNAGMALEVMVGGLELATLVFMDLKLDAKGPLELGGDRYGPMALSVVDTGYGLERFVWVSQGTPTIYDAIYPDTLKRFFELARVEAPGKGDHPEVFAESARLAGMMNVSTTSKLLEQRKGLVARLNEKGIRMGLDELMKLMVPVESVFTVADHSRCILLMLADGIVPSNVKAGYLARLVIRKTLRLMDELRMETPLADLVLLHKATTADILKVGEYEGVLRTMLELETKRYRETTEKGQRMVRRLAKEAGAGAGAGRGITVEKLVELYDSHGIHPALVQAVAAQEGITVDVPDGFTALVASRHAGEKKPEEFHRIIRTQYERPTRTLYYEHPNCREFNSKVIGIQSYPDGKEMLILEETAFYPEGGGQHADTGWIDYDGKRTRVIDVQKEGNVIMHILESQSGTKLMKEVHGIIDWRRRMAHSRHHTATHIIISSSRKVLGHHVWQAGAEKGEKGAHVDISHYDKVTLDQVYEIERVANEIVADNLPVEFMNLPREEAERRYGMALYQGGAPAGSIIRVVRIADFDSEACGGTHTQTTGEVGLIKITRAERIQDGVVRLEYSASLAALDYFQSLEKKVIDSSVIVKVQPMHLVKTVERFYKEANENRKIIQEYRNQIVHNRISAPYDKIKLDLIKNFIAELERIENHPSLKTSFRQFEEHIKNSNKIKLEIDSYLRETDKIKNTIELYRSISKNVPHDLFSSMIDNNEFIRALLLNYWTYTYALKRKKEQEYIGHIRLIIDQGELDTEGTREISRILSSDHKVVCILISRDNTLIISTGHEIDIDIRTIVDRIRDHHHLNGGGKSNYYEIKSISITQRDLVFNEIVNAIKEALGNRLLK
jgi:alanyl-tRNA synthetase